LKNTLKLISLAGFNTIFR